MGLGTGEFKCFGGEEGTFWELFSNIFSLLLLNSVDVRPTALLGLQTFPPACKQVCRAHLFRCDNHVLAVASPSHMCL